MKISRKSYGAFILGFALAGGASLLTFFLADIVVSDRGTDPRHAEVARLAPQLMRQAGPLADGMKITPEQAEARSPYRLAMPPTNAVTGKRTAVWIDPTQQIAFTWNTDLRFYVQPQGDLTEEEAVAAWKDKAAAGEGVLMTVQGVTAIGHERTTENPAALSFIKNGLVLQFVGGTQSLEELRQLGEAITYE